MIYQQQVTKLKQARGKHYVDLFRVLDADDSLGGVLRQEVIEMKRSQGRFTLISAGMLALKYDLPIATLFRMIEAPGVVAVGTWDLAKDRGAKVKDILDAARAKLEEQESDRP